MIKKVFSFSIAFLSKVIIIYFPYLKACPIITASFTVDALAFTFPFFPILRS